MSLRTRLALAAAAAVGLAVLAASVVVYVVVHQQLRNEIDHSLETRLTEIANGPFRISVDENGYLRIPGPGPGVESTYVQAVFGSGNNVVTELESPALPPSNRDRRAAEAGHGRAYFSDKTVQGTKYRVLTLPSTSTAGPLVIQVFRPLKAVDRTLHRITVFLFLIAAGGMGVAAALGLLVSRAALTPVRRLTHTAEAVTETRDLSQRIEPTSTGDDELGRLAGSFNTMLAALEASSRAQRQLVADASHELRTPLTSLRTNIEVLARGNKLAPGDRERLLDDVVEQIDEMTALIGELIELARETRPDAIDEPAREVRLDELAAEAVERARRNRPEVDFTTDFDDSVVHGTPSRIERAVANLLDNAAKWSPPGGPVEVAVREGEVSVRDHGPGIADEDLPYVFDRFYRSRDARGMPGSGLGLAIVKQVAESHGGAVVAERPEDGGTLMRMRLNGGPHS
ncbi:MAG TPA: HAMP domain-containing sensor histidine kinase [Gaiellaceae bacterium]|nr:HAMP domain-containing sensor histidine kinase [Gaiellaceae bacterium]